MIDEFAVEPETVAGWGDRENFRYFCDKFGLGTSRLVSRYPGKWRRRVIEAVSTQNDIERKRIEELVIRLSERMVVRPAATYDGTMAWLDNAEAEHARSPFHAIIARDNPTDHVAVLRDADIGPASPLWKTSYGRVVPKSAADMSALLSRVGDCATAFILVDPYFNPAQKSYRDVLAALFEAIGNAGSCPLTRLEIHSSDKGTLGTPAFFEQECRNRLQRMVPAGLQLRIVRWQKRSGGEDLHDRYLLTDLGGLLLSAGFDAGHAGETINANLLDRAQYELRWRQYCSDDPSFDLYQEVFVR